MTTAAQEFDPQLLRTLRAAPWRRIERQFVVILAASIGLHFAFATYLSAQPRRVEGVGEEVDPGFHRAPSLPPLHKIPKILNTVSVVPARPAPVARPSPAPGVDRAKVAKLGILGVIAADGPQGAFQSLIGTDSTEIVEALKDAHARVEVSATEAIGPKGARTGDVATVAPIGTEGVKKVRLAPRVDARPSPTPDGPIVVEHTTDVDPRVLQQFITARRAAVQNCYERALLHNPGLQGGKVVLRLAVGVGGRVNELDIEEDTLGSEAVTSCMSTLVKRWVFPVAPKEELPVSVPFVFARSN